MDWFDTYLKSSSLLSSYNILDMSLISTNLLCLLTDAKMYHQEEKDIPNHVSLHILNLCEIKKSANSKTSIGDAEQSYIIKLLLDGKICHEIIHLSLSQKGQYAAIYGEKGIYIISLPNMYHLKKGYLKSFHVSCNELDASVYRYVTIKKVVWHPLSQNDSHIMILASDNIIRMYNIDESIEYPEQSFNLLKRNFIFKPYKKYIPTNRFAIESSEDEDEFDSEHISSFSNDEKEIASFSLGQSRQDWSVVSLYYILSTGEFYCLCPVLPYVG
jgi:hypothetical protein